jgi:tetratricopeptide (TPR) repeat protein
MYQTVIHTKPGTSSARRAQLAIGKLHIDKINRPEVGVRLYQDLIAVTPDSEEAAEAQYRLGVYYFKAADYESAQKSFDTIVNQFPHLERSHNAQLMLAKSHESAQNFEKAMEIYDNVANRHPDAKRAGGALISKARIQKKFLRDEREAKRTYQSLVKRYGRMEGAEETIEEAKRELRSMGASIPEPDPPLASKHERLLEKQKLRRERDRPRGGVELSPTMDDSGLAAGSGFGVSPQEIMKAVGPIQLDGQGTYFDAMLMIANAVFQSENYRDAGALYHRGIELTERAESEVDPYHYLRLSVCYRKIGLHQRAREVLKEALKKDKRILNSIITSGATQYINGEYTKAIETYSSVLELSPAKTPELYWRLGLVCQKMGEVERGREYFERAIAADTDYTDALQSLAEVLHYRLNDTPSAEIFQNLVDVQNKRAISLETTYAGEKALGDICYKYGNYPRAKSKYEAAARIAQREKEETTSRSKKRLLDNQHIYVMVHAAMASYKSGMEDKAQAMIDALTIEYPEHSLILYGQGQLAVLKGEVDAALVAFKASMERDSYSDTVPLALGEYYLSQGFADEAVALWEEFIKANPNPNQHYRVQLRLKATKAQIKH